MRKTFVSFCALPFVAGLAYLLWPFFDGWSETFCPRLAYGWQGAMLFWWGKAPGIFLGVMVAYLLFAVVKRRPVRVKVLAGLACGLYLAAWWLLYPVGTSGTDRRVAALPWGARTRVALVGGPRRVRADARRLLDAPESAAPSRAAWPWRLRALGIRWVRVDPVTQTVALGIPAACPLCDTFAYLVVPARAPAPTVAEAHRMWQLAEGLYVVEQF